MEYMYALHILGVSIYSCSSCQSRSFGAENAHLKRDFEKCEMKKKHYFQLEQVKHDDKLIRFYTFFFICCFLGFLQLLGTS